MNLDEYAKMRALEDRYWWFVSRRNLALRLLDAYSPDAQRTLDLGCGTGAMLDQLQRRSPEAVGVDLWDEALQFSKARGLNNLVRANAEHLPFADATFDAVVALDTLEHVRDDRAAFAEAHRILRPGGAFIINVPAFRWLWGPHDVALMHQRRYTRAEVKDRLIEVGFSIRLLSYSVFFLFPAVVMRRGAERLARGPAEVRLPQFSRPTNSFLTSLMAWEGRLLQSVQLPWGSSVVAVAIKPEASPIPGVES